MIKTCQQWSKNMPNDSAVKVLNQVPAITSEGDKQGEDETFGILQEEWSESHELIFPILGNI